jgi:hypothetical protein
MLNIEHLLRLSDVYSVAVGAAEKTVSYRVFSDSKKFTALRSGADIGVNRFNLALRWFSDNWPENTLWPEGICRPEPRALKVVT